METVLGLVAVLGIAVVVIWFVLYRWGGATAASSVPMAGDQWGPFLVRTYRGREQGDVVAMYVEDAESLAGRGYEPVSQSWGDGQWDPALFLLSLLLCLFGIGVILLAYMAIIRPGGALMVTYRRQPA